MRIKKKGALYTRMYFFHVTIQASNVMEYLLCANQLQVVVMQKYTEEKHPSRYGACSWLEKTENKHYADECGTCQVVLRATRKAKQSPGSGA